MHYTSKLEVNGCKLTRCSKCIIIENVLSTFNIIVHGIETPLCTVYQTTVSLTTYKALLVQYKRTHDFNLSLADHVQ